MIPLRAEDLPHRDGARIEQVVVPHPLVGVDLAQVALARVGDEDDDDLVGLRAPRRLERRVERRAGRAARQNSLLAGEPSGQVERLVVVHRDDLVDHREIERPRKEVLPDPLDFIGLRSDDLLRIEILLEDRADRIGPDDLDLRILLLQEARRAADRAAGAEARDEVVDLPAGLAPDLGARAAVVGVGVGRIEILIRQVGAGRLADDPLRDLVIGVGRVGRHRRRRDDHLGAVRFQEVDLLPAHLVGHHENRAVPLHGSDHGETGSGVPRRRLHDRAAGLEQPLRFRLGHDRHGDPILDGAARIEALELGEHGRAAVLRHAPELDERRRPYGFKDRVVDLRLGGRGSARSMGHAFGLAFHGSSRKWRKERDGTAG